jgi:hypothetical protein
MLEVLVVVDHWIFLGIISRFLFVCFVNYCSHFVSYDLPGQERGTEQWCQRDHANYSVYHQCFVKLSDDLI